MVKVNFEFFMEGINEFSVFVVFDEFLNVRLFDCGGVKMLFELVIGVMVEIFLSCVLVVSGEVKFVNVDSENEKVLLSMFLDL